jgi:hypothetical protein
MNETVTPNKENKEIDEIEEVKIEELEKSKTTIIDDVSCFFDD